MSRPAGGLALGRRDVADWLQRERWLNQSSHSRVAHLEVELELRAAIASFVGLVNEQWLPEKNGFLSAEGDARSVVD